MAERPTRRTVLAYGAFAAVTAVAGGFELLSRPNDGDPSPDGRGGLAERTDDPVWLGRAADGTISCYLVDYLPRARPTP